MNRADRDDAPPETQDRKHAHQNGFIGEPPSEPDPKRDSDDSGPRRSVAARAVELALTSGLELFCDDEDTGYARLRGPNHTETWRIGPGRFEAWLLDLYYEQFQTTIGGGALKDARETLKARAIRSNDRRPTFTRIGQQDDRIYLNLCDREWRVVEVTVAGWKVLRHSPIPMLQPRGMLPLPVPERGGSIDELRPFANVTDEQWPLLVGWLVGALRPRGPYPVAIIRGGQDSAKSSTARMLRQLIDPNKSPLRAEPKEERDLAISAKNGWVIVLDNLSRIYPWLSDALCRVATGGGFAARTLYADDEETLFSFQRPIVLNGIGEIVTKPDLLDRAVLLQLPSLNDQGRREEDEFWPAFTAAHPRILGALLDACSTALRFLPFTRLEKRPRMADFATWVTAAETSFGWDDGTFLAAYTANREEGRSVALDASPVAAVVIELVTRQAAGLWEGTVKELLGELNALAAESTRTQRDWPKNERSLSVHLQRIAPALPVQKITYVPPRHTEKGRVVGLYLAEANPEANPEANLFSAEANHGFEG